MFLFDRKVKVNWKNQSRLRMTVAEKQT